MAVPTVLLFSSRVRFSPGALYGCAVMIVFGFVANRLNVGVTALESGSGVHYVPRWSEIAVTLSIIAVGFAIFRVIAQQFPVFEAESEHVASAVGMRKRLPHQVETVEERIEVG
jgi:Ni/Fe-hydrogenase subunit HybB-like protein